MVKKNKKNKIRHSFGDRTFDVLNYIFFGLFALICVYPIYYVLINSFSDNSLVMAGRVKFLPMGVHFQNYVDVLQLKGISAAALTSVARTVAGTTIGVVTSLIMGYTLSKKEYWHRKFWYRFIIITMYFSAGMIPTYMNYVNLGLINNPVVYVLGSFMNPSWLVLTKTYIESGIPDSLEEAAYIDGAGYFARFTRVIVPLCKPIAATIAIYAAVAQWNAYMDTVMYMRGDYETLQSVLYQYLNQANAIVELINSNSSAVDVSAFSNITVTSIKYTITAITIIPILFVYPFFQKHFAKGIMIGAVKG